MLITRISELTGKTYTRDIPITEHQFNRIENRIVTGEYIQDIVPNVEPGIREFILSGITPEEWEQVFETHRK